MSAMLAEQGCYPEQGYTLFNQTVAIAIAGCESGLTEDFESTSLIDKNPNGIKVMSYREWTITAPQQDSK